MDQERIGRKFAQFELEFEKLVMSRIGSVCF
jgi:hypothetical protein